MAIISALLPGTIRQRMHRWIAQRNPASSSSIELHSRRLYILPTRFGYLYAIMLVVLLLAAINYQNSMAYVLTFLLTALGIISLWQTHKNLLGLRVQLKTPAPVFQGEELLFEYILQNPNPFHRYAVGIQYAQNAPVYTGIEPEQTVSVTLSLPSLKRGLYSAGRTFIFTRFPTGLFHAWGWLKFDVPVLIYPKPQFEVSLKQSLSEHYSGQQTVDTVDGDDFAGLREHQVGESLRHISWKAYAQGRGMLTKTFQGHASPSLWIDWQDMPASSQEGKLSQMTALLLEAHRQGRNYGLRLPGLTLEQDKGNAHRSDCLQHISTFNQADIHTELVIDDS